MSKKQVLITTSFAAIFASQKSAGKTHAATFVADALTLNQFPYRAFQIDDQKRLGHMIGEVVEDLRSDPDLLLEDPTLATRAITPFYDSVRHAAAERCAVLLDTGANEVENLTNFLDEVGYAEDIKAWNLPTLAFVPFLPLDPESTAQSAFTVRRLLKAVPNIRVVLIENRHGGSAERIVSGSMAEDNYKLLLETGKNVERIIMPAIAREYWAPCEGAGLRFIKVLALDPEEGSRLLKRSIGEVKIMKSHVTRFWRAMHDQISQIIHLPVGGR